GLVVVSRQRLPSLGRIASGAVAMAAVMAICLLPSLLEQLGGRDAWQLGLDLGLPASGFPSRPFAEDVNLYPLLTAAVACVWLFLSPRGRRQAIPLAATALCALVVDNLANRLI